jgi:hypothetical protein
MKKKLALILFILPLLAAGVVVTLALMRVINIPGLTPKKKALAGKAGQKKDAAKPGSKDVALNDKKPDPQTDPNGVPAKDAPQASATKEPAAKQAPAKAPAPKPTKDDSSSDDPPPRSAVAKPKTSDPDKGASKLAAVWGEMKPDDLLKIIPSYKDSELGPILKKMDEGAVAKILAKLPPDKAASLSRAIESAASQLPAPSG